MNKAYQWEQAPPNSVLGVLEVGPECSRDGRDCWRTKATASAGAASALCSFSDALTRFSREHLRREAMAPHYVSYLLAALNHQSALR